MTWYDSMLEEIDAKIQEAGNHVVIIPSQDKNAPIDSVDIYDGHSQKYIALGIPENTAQEFAVVWNNLVDSGEANNRNQSTLMTWITDSKSKHTL